MEREELHDLLERLWDRYDREEFISADPIAVPHCFASRDDREIAGFLAATIAWGSRPMIVRNGLRMMHFLDDAPHDFVRNASERELAKLSGFVHRTFNGGDLIQFVRSIRAICERHGGLGRFVEASYASTGDMRRVLAAFREEFFRTEHPERCRKHVSSIERGASCKRLCMYFRWMVRHDDRGVDFGLWRTIPPSALYLPLDLHTGNMGRALGLLARRQNDWRAVEEITAAQLEERCADCIIIRVVEADTERYAAQLERFFPEARYRVLADKSIRITGKDMEEEVVSRLAYENGILITALERRRYTLEDYYMNLKNGGAGAC